MRGKIDQHYSELEHYLKEQKEQVTLQLNDAIGHVLAATLAEAKNDMLITKDLKKDDLVKKSDQDLLSADVDAQRQVINNCMQTMKSNYDKVNFAANNVKSFPSRSILPQFQIGNFPFVSILPNTELLIPTDIYLNEEYTVTLLTKDAKGQYCSKGGDNVAMELETLTTKTTLEVKDNCDGSYEASFVVELVGAAKLVVFINGLQISTNRIVVLRRYQALEQPNKVININGKPYGVAVGRYGVWTVADYSNDCMYLFDGKDQLIRKIGSRGKNVGEFVNPRGVALDNENHIYVVDGGNHRVQKFDINGNYLLQFGGHGKGDGQLNNPHGITTHDNKVYIADYSNHRIVVFQCDGKFCISFGSSQLGGPYDIAVNVHNELIVVDPKRYNMATFTLDGFYRGRFGNFSMNGACCLTTDVNGFVLLGRTDDFYTGIYRVIVLDYDGNLIKCFGPQGSDVGEFNGAMGIALNHDGAIYVSDHKNKRIQIYANYC